MRRNRKSDGLDLANETVVGPSEKSSTLPLNAPIAPAMLPPPAPTSVDILNDITTEDHAPSRQSLLMRAAQLGPQRLTLDNIMMAPTDPVLAQKIQPRVAERRARFRTVVKVALGVCAGLCLIGTAATALSSSGPAAKSAPSAVHGTAPAAAFVPKETLELPKVTKAEKVAATPVPHAAPAPRGRLAKRR